MCCCNNDASGPNGVLTVDSKEAWAEMATARQGDRSKSMKIVDTISTGGKTRADETMYDPGRLRFSSSPMTPKSRRT